MLALSHFDPELWYCFLVVKTPTTKTPPTPRRRQKNRDAAEEAEEGAEEATTTTQYEDSGGGPAVRKRKRRTETGVDVGERRTSICYAKDPLAFVERLNRGPGAVPYVYEIVTIMGPLATEADGRLIKVAWNYKSRGVIPRALWAQELSCKFNIPICHNPPVMLGLQEHFDVMARDRDVYLYPRNVIVT